MWEHCYCNSIEICGLFTSSLSVLPIKGVNSSRGNLSGRNSLKLIAIKPKLGLQPTGSRFHHGKSNLNGGDKQLKKTAYNTVS